MAEVVVVSCVLESSLVLAAEWPHILSDYLVPLLHRLTDGGNPNGFRMSCIGYGTADTRPNPILGRVPFLAPAFMLQKMREHPRELGIGRTGSGAGFGMAALEGLVAALEMIDTLKSNMAEQKAELKITWMLVHIASTPPDPAERPLWNISPALDSVTWDTLPSEMRKRGVHYSSILLNPIPRFTELHTSAAIGASQTPWFTVKTPHAVHLSGFPLVQKGTKRPGANVPAADRSPESSKRVKVQATTPQKSPAVAPAVPPPPSSSPPTSTPAPPAPPPAAEEPVPLAVPLDPTKLPELRERLKNAETHLRAQMAHILQLEKSGQTEMAKQQRITLTQRAEKLRQFKSQMLLQAQAAAAGRPPAAGPSTQPAAAPRTQLSASKPSEMPPSQAPAPQLDVGRSVPHPSAVPATLASHTAKPPVPTPIPPQSSHDVAIQMQKLLEQKNRQPAHPPAPAPLSRPGTWTGNLTWRGFDSETHIRKDVHTRVAMACKDEHINNMRPDTWPPGLALAPSQHPAVPDQMLFKWLQQHKFVPLTVQAAHPPSDALGLEAKANEEHYRGLIRLLAEKNIYALSAWPGANGVPENRLLIFAPSKQGLAAAYFPLPGGVPELPKGDALPIPGPSSVPAPTPGPQPPVPLFQGIPPQFIAYLQQNFSPEQQAKFNKLPPDQKMVIIKNLAQRMVSVRQQQQQQAAAAQQQQHQQQQQQQAQQLQPQQPGLNMGSWAAAGGNMAAFISQLQGPPPLLTGSGPGLGAAAGPSNPSGAPLGMGGMGGMGAKPGGLPMGMMANMANMNMNVGGAGANMGMNFGMQPPGPLPSTGMMPGQGMHRRTSSNPAGGGGNPGGGGNFSFEMLQSFMQRTQDGSGGGGPNGALGGMA